MSCKLDMLSVIPSRNHFLISVYSKSLLLNVKILIVFLPDQYSQLRVGLGQSRDQSVPEAIGSQ